MLLAAVPLAAVLLAACARPAPPPGGPEDKEPPYVTAVFPESAAVAVDLASELRITFSEPVDRRSVEDAIWVVPGGSISGVSVSGTEARVRLRGALPESATVGVLVATSLRDRRNIPMEAPYRWIFATGEAVDPGSVRGTVQLVGGRATGGVVLVGLYPAGEDTLPDPRVVPPAALTQTDRDGRYALTGVPADGRLLLLFGLFDRDGNRDVGGPGEFVSASPESVRLTGDVPALEIDHRLVDPEAPCEIKGTLERAAEDTIPCFVEAYEIPADAPPDSLGEAAQQGPADAQGTFTLRRLPPGRYRLVAYCDADGNRRRDPEEAWIVLSESVDGPAGATIDLGAVPGPRCGIDAGPTEP